MRRVLLASNVSSPVNQIWNVPISVGRMASGRDVAVAVMPPALTLAVTGGGGLGEGTCVLYSSMRTSSGEVAAIRRWYGSVEGFSSPSSCLNGVAANGSIPAVFDRFGLSHFFWAG